MYISSVGQQGHTVRGLLVLRRPSSLDGAQRTSGLILADTDQTQASKECPGLDAQRQLRGRRAGMIRRVVWTHEAQE